MAFVTRPVRPTTTGRSWPARAAVTLDVDALLRISAVAVFLDAAPGGGRFNEPDLGAWYA